MFNHLCYHIWPCNIAGDNWLTAIDQLIRRINLFDGVRSICVAVDERSATLLDVQKKFENVRIDNWLYVRNSPEARECISFESLLRTVPQDSGYTLWCHGKSVRHAPNSIPVKWAEWQYKLLCDRFDIVKQLLDQGKPIVGCFLRRTPYIFGPSNFVHGKSNKYWHFSGGVYWINNAKVFSINDWEQLPKNFFAGTEAWPGVMFKEREVGCVGPTMVNDLYRPEEWVRLNSELEGLTCSSK